MAARARNHHIVPEVLQKQFTIPGHSRRIWRAKRNKENKFNLPEEKSIGKSFVVRDYNTIIQNENPSDIIEKKFYGEIDDYLGRFLPEITQIFADGRIPLISGDALKSLRLVVLEMAKRTPDFLVGHSDVEVGREAVEGSLKDLPDNASMSLKKQLEAELADIVKLRVRGRHIRVTATIEVSERIKNALADFKVRWSVSETKHSYIISSIMVYRIGNGGPNGIVNPNMEFWMPITPKIALILVRDPLNIIPLRSVDTPDHIRQVNVYAIQNSFEVGSHSKDLLNSLLKTTL